MKTTGAEKTPVVFINGFGWYPHSKEPSESMEIQEVQADGAAAFFYHKLNHFVY